ncbi:5-amino-6-(D-ribitylamino)uracil--L-tyrosine 4-hydroxyphenyl transferase CofH [Pseudomaricurvus alkylphenolicus]|uniref:5-amino-6-(D-ribitylamino)uracil--L-tyrosine 4-hydroxyphenyl transferase CofH n=1 Tax=Pseudomaricurvus alkylphenolicus TaxID=1306991 RepID=UPI0014223640|nr:5-amino-6-(D-ribitylamino)uracil--L-tyrosine 4-hydroxyphenyl transferase CofH [Pseudomaricurvus alkylphenolicus]NIB38409.1 5-amino-6-(D-ribitylamino)uracil--L-tyrosine 4-hydroxyphenyl transferase CofH [Pseudomaricurvus alkylphenolicus]
MWAIVPVKSFGSYKTRLSSVLSEDQRREFMQAMCKDVVDELNALEFVDRVKVVCSNSDFFQLPLPEGCELLALPQDRDLNSAISAALEDAASAGVERAMVVHADLPLIDSRELSAIVHEAEGAELVLVPCADNEGTNAILVDTGCGFSPSYGRNSFQCHLEAATAVGLRVKVIRSKALGVDIDTPEQLEKLIKVLVNDSQYHNRSTYQLLEKYSLAAEVKDVILAAEAGDVISDEQSLSLATAIDTQSLMAVAGRLRDQGFGNYVTYSKKVFIPLTHLCRDVCHYCTFAKVPNQSSYLYMSEEQVLEVARQGADLGCKEALLTLGEKPELRYSAARKALAEMGFKTTLEYVAHMAKRIHQETGLLPHINAGCMDEEEVDMLRRVSASMGIMLESASERLCEKGMPHYGSPDKEPSVRLQSIERAGKKRVPFTTGILIGIGETRYERIESLLSIRQLHQQYGHIQEVIVQNFRAKPGTKMAISVEPDDNELLWTIAVARLIFGAGMSIQVPPNLNRDSLASLINAGINDWGGLSPLTPDFVNPEAPWPQLSSLANKTAAAGKWLHERLTVYPDYVRVMDQWCDNNMRPGILRYADGEGYASEYDWLSGVSDIVPTELYRLLDGAAELGNLAVTVEVQRVLEKVEKQGDTLTQAEIVTLFSARGKDFQAVCSAADKLRRTTNGEQVTYVVNRNINYTNICGYHCTFCAFSKGKVQEELREKPYNLSLEEIQTRALDAKSQGATEVCLQGGIHPSYDGHTYINICNAIHQVAPDLHIHAFSPLEVMHGAQSLGLDLNTFLSELKSKGLKSLPGTAAEILCDDVREILCPDKINTQQWLTVMREAHALGIPTTATIMFGHVDNYSHWARHLLAILDLQKETMGFTEFVPLPFVAHEAPIYKRGLSRRGPSLRESLLMHAVSRLVLNPYITNIQASWVKLGPQGARLALSAGVNDMGGVLMNESITRAAGASHGQQMTASVLANLIRAAGRLPAQRTTLYEVLEASAQSCDESVISAVLL